jgi:hypothetical protein
MPRKAVDVRECIEYLEDIMSARRPCANQSFRSWSNYFWFIVTDNFLGYLIVSSGNVSWRDFSSKKCLSLIG